MSLNNDCNIYKGSKKDCPVSENGRTYRLINNTEFYLKVFKVDGCLIKDNNQQKCDFLIVINQKPQCVAYFIELKGSRLIDAIQQIMSSIDILYKSIHEHIINARIVGKRVTPDIKSRRAKLDEKLKKFGGNLIIASISDYPETI
jgi:hypothetical protein